ncbi:hypothetical protein Q1695_008379 [Nippostrongylus brasiliensis]|nr:hypothetical protein Q1695_008379 [Nippostrongylus brasiliensis]
MDGELNSPGIIAFFNDFRSAIAKGVFADGSPTKLAQSDGLFKIVDDPTLAKYAAAEAGDAVNVRLPAEYSRAVYSTQLTYASDTTFVRKALDVWYRYAIGVLPADNATYLQRDVATLDGYAQAVYYKSVRGSCVIRRNIFSTPSGKKGTILACVFNSRPVVGQTLYPVKRSPTQGKGCTIDCSCQYYSGSNGSKCDTASGLCIAGIGSTFPSHTTPSTGTSTTRTTPSTTTTTTTASTKTTRTTPSITTTTKKPHTKTTRTTPSITTTTKRPAYDINCPGNVGMDVSMREKALLMLNYRRRELASNKVQHSDGAFLPAGANLVTLKYHCDLESAAQAEANKCAASSGSGLEGTRENFYRKKARSKMDALVDGIKSWWNEVRRVGGVNRNTLTFTSANQNSPVRFMTLMAWANVRSMGCGVRQCGRYYNVVCRFDPRGNIVNQAIYQKGKACSACPAGFRRCVDNLCTA